MNLCSKKTESFGRNESGSATTWALSWLTGFCIMCGLSIDATNAFRHKTMMQASTDAAAHAALMDLPDATNASDAADHYLRRNYGTPDVEIGSISRIDVGYWEPETRTFSMRDEGVEPVVDVEIGATPQIEDVPSVPEPVAERVGEFSAADGGAQIYSDWPEPKNAVRVRIDRRARSGSGVATHVLGLVGFSAWDISAEAIAHRAVHPCLKNGMIARGRLEIGNNNVIRSALCLHADVELSIPDGTVVEDGAQISVPDVAALGQTRPEQIPGFAEAFEIAERTPAMVSEVDWVAENILSGHRDLIPAWINLAEPVEILSEFVLISNDGEDNFGDEDSEVPGVLEDVEAEAPGLSLPRDRIYHAPCPDKLTIDGTVRRIVIVTSCAVDIRPNAVLEDVVIVTTAERDDASATVNLGVRVRLGKDDNCAHGGGVVIVANASIHSAAQAILNGAMMVANGDIRLSPAAAGINGAALHALDDIRVNGEDVLGPCQEEVPFLFSPPSYTYAIVH